MFITTIFDTSHALFLEASLLFQSMTQNDSPTPYAVLFPGGNTPRPLFHHIAVHPFPVSAKLHIGYTDERMVPANDPANNYALSVPMLNALNIKSNHIHRIDTSLELEDAANKYDDIWKEFFSRNGAIPIAFLGIGTDGHTCSLFTEEQVLHCSATRYAEAVRRDNGPDRITVTPALLAKIRHVIVLATGLKKAAIVQQLSQAPDTLVVGKALAACPKVSIWYASQQ